MGNKRYLFLIYRYDREFFQTFRVTKKVYSYIVGRFERSMHFKYRESAKCVLLGLNYLGHQTTTYSGLAKRFNVSATTASQIVDDFTGFLGELFYQFIKWPTGSRRQSNIRKFRKCHNIPNVIGCMSACYIRFTPSKITDEISSYRDAKNGCYASLLQAICDTDLIFFYILGGCPLESSTTEANSPPANLTDPLRKYAREWCNGNL